MKTLSNKIGLLGIVSLIIFSLSCKKEEISPNEKFVGIYDYNGNIIPDDQENFPKGKGIVAVISPTKIIIYEQLPFSPERKWEFSECEISAIDPTGDPYKHYAKIVDKKTGKEIGQIRDFDYYPTGNLKKPSYRIRIDMDFVDDKNEKIVLYAIKRKD